MKDLVLTLFGSLTVSAREATRQLRRSLLIIPGMIALFLGFFTLTVIAMQFGGILGGFILGIGQLCALTLFYQWILEARTPHGLRFSDMRSFDGELFFALLSVAFPLFLIQFALGLSFAPQGEIGNQNSFAQTLQQFVQLLIIILLNPIVEVVLNARVQGIEAMTRSIRFVLDNWIEWLIPFVLLMAPALLISDRFQFLLFSAPADFIVALVTLFSATDALFPITPVIKWWLAGLSVQLDFRLVLDTAAQAFWVLPVLLLGAWFQLFRLHYFEELEGSSRRSRIFRAKQGG